ncbi:MAG TPA: ATP-binding protein [Rhodanobacteraceae bacterium]|nr:ATP-binding protein [Rhodanobacteraceae bacterium]
MIRSLRARLTALTLSCIGFVMVPLLALSGAKVVEEVDELSDARLAQSAKTLEAFSNHLGIGMSSAPVEVENWFRPKGADEATPQGHGYETQVGFQYWSSPSQLAVTTQDLRNLTFDAAPIGFADVTNAKRKWRVYTKIGDNGGFIRAAERYDSRHEIVRDLLLQNTLPLVLGLPVLAFLTKWAVKKGLQPLSETARRIDQRSPDDAEPLNAHDAPDEIAPLVGAINGLMRRVHRALDNERQFTSNAAHELRTPLAGALVHVGNALTMTQTDESRAALSDTRGALQRMTRLVNQMLELARWDAASSAKAMSDVDLVVLVREELSELAATVIDREVEVVQSFAPSVPAVRGWEGGLRVLVRNILDNALRYGRAHGTLSIEIQPDEWGVLLAISDDGTGIEASLRDAMFSRFQRGEGVDSPGVGLGLPIAQRIAELHRASLRLLDAGTGRGLRVEVRFPRGR